MSITERGELFVEVFERQEGKKDMPHHFHMLNSLSQKSIILAPFQLLTGIHIGREDHAKSCLTTGLEL